MGYNIDTYLHSSECFTWHPAMEPIPKGYERVELDGSPITITTPQSCNSTQSDGSSHVFLRAGKLADPGDSILITPFGHCRIWLHLQMHNARPLPLFSALVFTDTPEKSTLSTPRGFLCKAPDGTIGIVPSDGPDHGNCLTQTSNLEGGYHILSAYVKETPYLPPLGQDHNYDAQSLASEIVAKMRKYIDSEDLIRVERVANTTFAEFEAGLEQSPARVLARILESDRFVHSELNKLGLHLYRCLLAERMNEARRIEHQDDPDVKTFKEQGFLFKDFTKMDNADLRALLMKLSGYPDHKLPALSWDLRPTYPNPDDPNRVFHMDTFHSAWKVWLYAQDVQDKHGPFTIIPGSHRMTDQKMDWLYYRSNNPPEKGPSSYGSFRITHAELKKFDFPEPQGLEGSALSLLIADVSGIHARGVGSERRNTFVLHDKTSDGGLPRLNPFVSYD